RQRLHHHELGRPEVLRERPVRIGAPLKIAPVRDFVGHDEANVVPRVPVFATRIPEPDDQLHDQADLKVRLYFFASFFASSPSFSVLPFLMTSGSAAAAAAGTAAPSAAVVVAADSSAFGITTWTSIVSPSVTAFHFGLVGMSFTRID